MAQVIIYLNESSVAQLIRVPEGLSAAALATASVPQGTAYQIHDESSIPDEPLFRAALGIDLSVDMTKARNLWRDELRKARATRWSEFDVAWLRALEGDDAAAKAALVSKRQALRDITADPAIDAAADINALKTVRPAALDAVV